MIGLSALGPFRTDVEFALPALPENSYENIFRIYTTEGKTTNQQLYYNILNSVYIPTPLVPGTYYAITLQKSVPWTVISYDEYRTINLWWLIVLANNILNPVLYPSAGTTLNIIKPQFISNIINSINTQLKQ
jgi:prophage DNA circulation protein